MIMCKYRVMNLGLTDDAAWEIISEVYLNNKEWFGIRDYITVYNYCKKNLKTHKDTDKLV